jgi:OFA family oxalate/formate antiporter-like MFS transporter
VDLTRKRSLVLLVAWQVLAFIVLLCYRAAMAPCRCSQPTTSGPRNVGSVYGLMLTAWGVAGIVGPTLIARIRESTGAYRNALYVIAVTMLSVPSSRSSSGRPVATGSRRRENRRPPPI